VGGLADTVTNYAPGRRSATGFVFEPYTPAALLEALNRALALYPNRQKWRRLQAAGMKVDHSWDRSAREYVKIYERAMKPRNLT
jgi:starch synthase